MARTPSNQDLPLGTVCPAFELPDAITGAAMGRGDVFGGPDDAQGRKGHKSGTIGDQPAVLMTVQLHVEPRHEPCHLR